MWVCVSEKSNFKKKEKRKQYQTVNDEFYSQIMYSE